MQRDDKHSGGATACQYVNGVFTDIQRAAVRPSSFDEATGTMEVVMSAESRVPAWDPVHGYVERITMSKGLKFRGGKQCPFMDNHNRYSSVLQNTLGSARGIEMQALEDGRQAAVSRVHFDMRSEEGRAAAGKYQDGHLTDVSIGFAYESQKATFIPAGEKKTVGGREYTASQGLPLLIVNKAEIWELSAVAVGADPDARAQSALMFLERQASGAEAMDAAVLAGAEKQEAAGLRNKENDMANDNQNGAPAVPAESTQSAAPPSADATQAPANVVSLDEARRAAAVEERQRIAAIHGMAAKLGVPTADVQSVIDSGVSADQAARALIEKHGGAQQAVSQSVQIIARQHEDSADARAIAGALISTMGHQHAELFVQREAQLGSDARDRAEQAVERGRRLYRGIGLRDAFVQAASLDSGRKFYSVRDALGAAQQSLMRDKLGLNNATQGVSGGAISYLFDVGVNTAVLMGWQQTPDTTAPFTRRRPCRSYLTQERVGLEHFSRLQRRAAGETAKHGSISDKRETYKVAEYAQKITIDQQDIINDTLGEFDRIATALGAAARRLVPDAVYATLAANAAMSDGVAIFASGHRNLATGGGSAISITAIKAAVAAMAAQYVGSGKDKVNINAQMKYIVTGTTNAQTAWEALNSQIVAATGSTDAIKATRNILNTYGIEVIGEGRITNGFTNPFTGAPVAADTGVWYGFADPATIDGIEVGYIDALGEEPIITSKVLDDGMFGVSYTVQMTVGVGVLGFQGLYKAAGS